MALTIFEVQKFVNAESHAELIIDMSHRDDFVNVNIDVTFPKLPCDVISLDESDLLGTRKNDIMGTLKKNRLSKEGKVLSTENQMERNDFRRSVYERVKKEMDDKQGCQLIGTFQVYRVPGNFHIGSHQFGDIKGMLIREGYDFDFTYEINHLSFGNMQDFEYIKENFHDLDMDHPADGVHVAPNHILDKESGKMKPPAVKTNFYLVAVPSYFEKGFSRYHVY